jgi:molybdopterin molybdotransferase
MISVQEARQIISAHCHPSGTIQLPIVEAVGSVLAEDLVAGISLPSFRQSSMDGYAIRLQDQEKLLQVQDALPAGSSRQLVLQPFQTVKVFTGGPVPEGADTVIQKEWVKQTEDQIQLCPPSGRLALGANIREIGSDIRSGTTFMRANTVIKPMHMGVLAGLGFTTVPVYKKPAVAILITGNELVSPGSQLAAGQVYESNSYAVSACLAAIQMHQPKILFAKDNAAETEAKIREALAGNELVLITGGVSVGDYDFVAAACRNAGVEQHFHGVRQRPGKPLFFGTGDKTLVFGLPGNPSSVLSCFYQYVLPAIQAVSGIPILKPEKRVLTTAYEKKAPLCFFLKGFQQEGTVSVLTAQASYQQQAFVQANCWIELPEEKTLFKKGEEVIIHHFL